MRFCNISWLSRDKRETEDHTTVYSPLGKHGKEKVPSSRDCALHLYTSVESSDKAPSTGVELQPPICKKQKKKKHTILRDHSGAGLNWNAWNSFSPSSLPSCQNSKVISGMHKKVLDLLGEKISSQCQWHRLFRSVVTAYLYRPVRNMFQADNKGSLKRTLILNKGTRYKCLQIYRWSL